MLHKKEYGTLTFTKECIAYANTINKIPIPRPVGGYERMGINDYNLSNMRCNVKGALICHGKCALVIAYVTRSRGFPCVVNAWKHHSLSRGNRL